MRDAAAPKMPAKWLTSENSPSEKPTKDRVAARRLFSYPRERKTRRARNDNYAAERDRQTHNNEAGDRQKAGTKLKDSMPLQTNSITHHAIEAAKHLWMVPYTFMGQPDPNEGFLESIVKDAIHTRKNRDDESFWYFCATTLAYAQIGGNAVIRTLANHHSTSAGDDINTRLIDQELDRANSDVTMTVSEWFRAASVNDQLHETIDQVSNVSDHPSGFDCTRNATATLSWFHCANGDSERNDRHSPCLNCPAALAIGNETFRTNLAEAINQAIRTSRPVPDAPNLLQCGPLPAAEGPATHCLKAIHHLAEIASRTKVGSDTHRGVACSAMAATDVIGQLHYLAIYVDTDEDLFEIGREADRIGATILTGEAVQQVDQFPSPDDYEECIVRRELTTGKTNYLCAPASAPEDWDPDDYGAEHPCRLCPMKCSIPENAVDRALQHLADMKQ